MHKSELDTPFVLIDMDKTDHNIDAMQAVADRGGVGLRPHAKTHKLPILAHRQIRSGAVGITVAKLGEAEAMAAAGITDILIAYPIVGAVKLDRLMRLVKQARVTVAVDSCETAAGIARAAIAAEAVVDLLVEMDCGFGRCGVTAGEATAELAARIDALPGVNVKGLLTFPGQAYDAPDEEQLAAVHREEGWLVAETVRLMKERGIDVSTVSAGSTPTARFASNADGVTEIRPGTYIFGDLIQVKNGAHRLEDCALTVKVTIVSRPAPDRAIIDAGTKIFTMDGENSPIGTGRGYTVGHPGIKLAWLTEEHGILELSEADRHLKIGDQLEIVPVHCCAVINMVDEVAAVRRGTVEAVWPVAGRGKSR